MFRAPLFRSRMITRCLRRYPSCCVYVSVCGAPDPHGGAATLSAPAWTCHSSLDIIPQVSGNTQSQRTHAIAATFFNAFGSHVSVVTQALRHLKGDLGGHSSRAAAAIFVMPSSKKKGKKNSNPPTNQNTGTMSVGDLQTELRELQEKNEVLRLKHVEQQGTIEELQGRCAALQEEQCLEWHRLRVSSPLTDHQEWGDWYTSRGWAWSHWETACPCCRRPLDVAVMATERSSRGNVLQVNTTEPADPDSAEPQVTGPVQQEQGQSRRFAYCTAIWGASSGYALGAAVLGWRLKELTKEGSNSPDRILLHTDDVPPNFLSVLSTVWTLQQVPYIDGVEQLYSWKGGAFDGVFTKVAAWSLTDYDKVLLLDIDLVILRSPEKLFELPTPAAFVRGHSNYEDGQPVNGRGFFRGEADDPYPWQQGGGINAGVILLQPCQLTFERMVREVKCPTHPEHVHGSGPEQDYLSRFFAAAPWYAMNVIWNFQVHHIPFALAAVLETRRRELESMNENTEYEVDLNESWMPPRLTVDMEAICIVHFSGDIKPWHFYLDAQQSTDQRRAVEHHRRRWENIEVFLEHLLHGCCSGSTCWLTRSAPAEEYAHFGVELFEKVRFRLRANPEQGPWTEVTTLIDGMVTRLTTISKRSFQEWNRAAMAFFSAEPKALEELERIDTPQGYCYPPGTKVQVCWPSLPPGTSHEEVHWHIWVPAKVVSVHKNGRHVVRYCQSFGTWGDTEREVVCSRLRSANTQHMEDALLST